MSKSSRDAFEFHLIIAFWTIITFADSYFTKYTVTKYGNFIGLLAIIFTFRFIQSIFMQSLSRYYSFSLKIMLVFWLFVHDDRRPLRDFVFDLVDSTFISFFNFRLLPDQKNCFICFDELHSRMMKMRFISS